MFIQSFIEPARNYRFTGYFYKDSYTYDLYRSVGAGFNLDDFNKKLFLISNLIKIVRAPTTDIEIDEIDLGSIKYPIPKRLVANQFDVVFLEDNSRIVSKVFNYLIELLAPKGQLNFTLFNHLSFTFIYTKNLSYSADTGLDALTRAISKGNFSNGQLVSLSDLASLVEIPSHVEMFPQVFPIKANFTDMDKGGDTFCETTLTFLRIPKIIGI